MTTWPDAWGGPTRPVGGLALGPPAPGPSGASEASEAWHEEAAVRALDRAQSAVEAALGRLAPAADVDWSGASALRYRRDLEDLTHRLRLARSQAEVAVHASARHAASVRRLAAADHPWPSPWPPSAVGRGLVPGERDP